MTTMEERERVLQQTISSHELLKTEMTEALRQRDLQREAMRIELTNAIATRDLILQELKRNIEELKTRTRSVEDYDQRRIHNAQLLKGKEPTELSDKDTYAS